MDQIILGPGKRIGAGVTLGDGMTGGEWEDERARRFAVFHIGEEDLQLLGRNAAFAETQLPNLLSQWHVRFAQWPEIQAALMNPEVHDLRVVHWGRVVSGRLDDAFAESARRLAQALYDNGVPGYALAICHYTVCAAVAETLGLADSGDRTAFFRRNDLGKAEMRAALAKVTWFDLELLLEVYAAAERAGGRGEGRQSFDGSARARAMAATVGTLAEAVQRIDAAAGVIDQIAGEANLLALDAAIEAARNGDAGKGFAASAPAVRRLAAQATRSAQDISIQVADLDGIVARSTTAIDEVETMIDQETGADAAHGLRLQSDRLRDAVAAVLGDVRSA
jgi:hypothetical protein